ncbi:hypothetical protein HMPREF1545_00157 [Oscillibacter sp. KLE 1728]|nr:hypothetical protein HMPREF1545_00157 [Oscillibacter sp. KLE 1728]
MPLWAAEKSRKNVKFCPALVPAPFFTPVPAARAFFELVLRSFLRQLGRARDGMRIPLIGGVDMRCAEAARLALSSHQR